MSEEILMNVTPMESRVALVENGVLQEVFIERQRNRGLVGNIYLGKVVRVLPGMQAAFIDIGFEKASFIHVSDIASYPRQLPRADLSSDEMDSQTKPDRLNKPAVDIRTLLHEGQSQLVQVIKDPLGTKGARVSTHLSVSSRHLVYMPNAQQLSVSNKIDNPLERERLKSCLNGALLEFANEDQDQVMAGGYIIRTAAESVASSDFLADIRYLHRLWAALQRKITAQAAPSLIYEELQLCERTLRDFIYPELEKIRVDDDETRQRLAKFSHEFVPEIENRIETYESHRPIFDLFGVEDEISRALQRKVALKSGGYLIFDQTEALISIDVNTGGFVGKNNHGETVFKTNLEAATSLARQLRLRNLGGIVIIDFIDMENEEHQRQVLRTLEKAVGKDSTRTAIGDFSHLGLIEMTRKRTRESLEHILCESCGVCESRGFISSAETVCMEIFREIMREARAYDSEELLVLASPSVVDRLIDEDSAAVADLELTLGKTIRFRVEPVYTQEQYDVVLL